jgi:hypothetical protein
VEREPIVQGAGRLDTYPPHQIVERTGGTVVGGQATVVEPCHETTVDLLPTKSREQVDNHAVIRLLEWAQVTEDLVGDLAGGDDPEPVTAGCVQLSGPYYPKVPEAEVLLTVYPVYAPLEL